MVWRPDLNTYTAHIMERAETSTPATCKMNNADVPKIIVQGLGKAIQLWQEDVHVSELPHFVPKAACYWLCWAWRVKLHAVHVGGGQKQRHMQADLANNIPAH